MRDDYDKEHVDISHIEMGGSNSSANEQHYRSRLIHRNLPHGQSRNSPAVHIVGYKNVKWMLIHDWFHMVLRFPTSLSILILLLVWVLSIIIFALIYRGMDGRRDECSLGGESETISFHTAFAFSLETCTTVGYGLPGETNAFFWAMRWIAIDSMPSDDMEYDVQCLFNGFFSSLVSPAPNKDPYKSSSLNRQLLNRLTVNGSFTFAFMTLILQNLWWRHTYACTAPLGRITKTTKQTMKRNQIF